MLLRKKNGGETRTEAEGEGPSLVFFDVFVQQKWRNRRDSNSRPLP